MPSQVTSLDVFHLEVFPGPLLDYSLQRRLTRTGRHSLMLVFRRRNTGQTICPLPRDIRSQQLDSNMVPAGLGDEASSKSPMTVSALPQKKTLSDAPAPPLSPKMGGLRASSFLSAPPL